MKRVTLLLVTPYVAETDPKGRIVAGPGPVVAPGGQQAVQLSINEAQLQDWKWPPEFRRILEQLVADPDAHENVTEDM